MNIRKISIITPSLNRRDMLEDVIQNVLAQGYPNVEHIVIDGGSIDGTQDMVKKYPHVRFVCGPDQGMYDALNKGLDISTGEIVGFLNTDDLYADNIFTDVAGEFNDETVMAVAGHATVIRDAGNGQRKIVAMYSPEDKTLLECSTIGSNYFNAWFFRHSVFDKIGKFNIQYRIAGDRELMLRFALDRLRYMTINTLTYQYLQHSGSLTFDNTDQKREWSAQEHLIMTNNYLENKKLSSNERKLLIKLRTRETVDMAIRTMQTWNFDKSVYYFIEGIKYDFFWLFKLLLSVISLIMNMGIFFTRKTVNRLGKSILKGKQ